MWINKGKAFKIACGHNHLTIAEYLLDHYASSITSVDKGWALRWAFVKKHHGIVKYLLREFSHTFSFLPLLKKEAWSIAFRLNDFYILIERNGRRFSGETHLFFFQLNNKNIFYLELNHIERIALLLQRKCFPIQRWDDPDFHKSYCCITGSPTHNCLPAHIYCVGNLIPSEQVKQSFNVATPEINQPELSIVINYGKSLTPVFDTMKLDPFSNIPKEKYLQIDKGILPESVVNLLLTKHSSGKRA